LRLFFALWPPAETARGLWEWASAVRKQAGGNTTAEETIHLTLAFLGDADPVKAAAAARPVRAKSFDLAIDASQYWRHNRIIWVGPQTMPPELDHLVTQLHLYLRPAGFVLEDRPFAAHITLIRKSAPPDSLPPLPRVAWPAREFTLVRSVARQGGTRYEVIERFPLGQLPQ
jgi:2'-5' RNA ligase